MSHDELTTHASLNRSGVLMRDLTEIMRMRNEIRDNINGIGYDAHLEGALTALDWVINSDSQWHDGAVKNLLVRPAGKRREDWIALGGDPDFWPLTPDN